ncbi:MAG: peptidoglycan DD-metalloendopeptidase family protein [Ginsengibacter sp.]
MILKDNILHERLTQYGKHFHPVVEHDSLTDKIVKFDFSQNNTSLQNIDVADTEIFCAYINDLLYKADAKFGIGGYDELRNFYSRSSLFDDANLKEEPRRLHLGIDIWGKAGTEIFAPLDGAIHSFAFNDNFGDYGATIILKHELQNALFYTLYGHLSLADLQTLKEGDIIKKEQKFAHFGKPEENGHWPSHLHFQVIEDIGNFIGDYPGVCKYSEREKYLKNCPNPDLILNMIQKAIK